MNPKNTAQTTASLRPRPSTAAMLLLGTALMAPVSAKWVKVSDGAPYSDVGWYVGAVEISPDGEWAVYWHDPVIEDVDELYSVPTNGSSPPQRISGLLPFGGRGTFRISPDSQHVVYTAEQDTGDIKELYSVPIQGGPTVKLNGPLPSAAEVQSSSFAIDPGSSRVVYIADQNTLGVREIFSVPITGGTPTKLNGGLVSGGDVGSFAIDSTGSRVVYIADQQIDNRFELYSVPITGGSAVKVNGALIGGRIVLDFRIDPLGQRVVYRAGFSTLESLEIFSVPLGGGTATKLNGALTSGGSVLDYTTDPLAQRVVYIADQQVDERRELYSVPIGGGTPTKLNGALVAGGSVWGVIISPVGDRLAYTATQNDPGKVEVYTVGLTGGLPIKRNGPLSSNGDAGSAQFSPDGRWLVYRVTEPGIDPRLFRVAVTSRNTGTLLAERISFGSFYHFDAASERVVFLSHDDRSGSEIWRPWGVPLEDPLDPEGTSLVPRAAFQSDATLNELKVGANGFVIYVADQEWDHEFELYSIFPPLIFADGFEGGSTVAW